MSSNVKWRGEPLPRGRHHLSAAAVRDSQRARILRAMMECVGRRGYEGTTVPDVVATARVSRNAYYELFTDKADCFIAVCDEAADELLGELVALASESSWISAVRLGAHAYLRWWQQRPTLARAYFLSLPMVGERASQQRERQYEAFRAMFSELGRRARAEQPELAPLEELVPRVLVLAITELVADEVRARRTSRLTALSDQVALLAIRLLADDATAAQVRAAGEPERPAARAG
ncbi:MAG TPA: TetR/AcrR family transcriptional regulator [Solirubrobacteraceae bacterium]|nr:TetR/AcrR family transcriptional regulator [Solirubrobacteraceae bacterium]